MTTGVGIIGCGGIAHFHYEGFERAGARIVHCCDLRSEAAAAVAGRYGARASGDYRVLLDDPQVELVSVCTTASTHKEICLDAIAAGKGVVCEKTLTDKPADSAEIARAAERAGVFFGTAYMKNFFPAMQQARELLKEMGPVTSLYARTWQPFASLWDDPLPEFCAKHPSPMIRNYGGGVLVCGGSHVLNLVHGFAGRPVKVCGRIQAREGMDCDVQANAMLWLEDGGMGHFEAFWHPFRHAGYERNGWDERLEINTLKGRLDIATVLWNQPTNNGALLVHQDAATGKVTEYRYPAVNVFDVEMADMLHRFQNGRPACPSAWDGYVVDELIAHIVRSDEAGQAVDVRYEDR
jgi:predicted dehydrogenase